MSAWERTADSPGPSLRSFLASLQAAATGRPCAPSGSSRRRGFTQTGLKDDSPTPGRPRIAETRYWRYEDLSDGDELTWKITVRNTGDETVRVVGVRSDPSRERVLRPRELAGPAVTVEPGRTAEVEVRGEIAKCEPQGVELLYGTGTTEMEIESPPGEDAGTDVVDLDVRFEVASDAPC